MALRGPHEVLSYAPSNLPGASDDLLARVSALYQGDQQFHALWSTAMETRVTAADVADPAALGDQQAGGAHGFFAARAGEG